MESDQPAKRPELQLFRSEVLDSTGEQGLGELVIARSFESWMLLAFSVAIIFGIVGFLMFGTYTKRTKVSGVLLPTGGVINIYAGSTGIVSSVFIKEGERVKKGQKLFAVSDERALANVGGGNSNDTRQMASAVEETLRAQLAQLAEERAQNIRQMERSTTSLNEQKTSLRAELETLRNQIVLDRSLLESARQQMERDKKLAQASFLSPRALQERQDTVDGVEARLLASQREAISLQRDLTNVESDLAMIPIKNSALMASFGQKKAAIEQDLVKSAGSTNSIVVAPADGVIAAILTDPGSPSNARPIATLLPSDSLLEAAIFVPSKAVGFIEPGQSVLLRYQPYPYQKFGQYAGVVKQVSRAPIAQENLPLGIPKQQGEDGLYRVTVILESQNVKIYGRAQPLVAGTVFDADVLQETRRLIEWVFEPVFSISGKFLLEDNDVAKIKAAVSANGR